MTRYIPQACHISYIIAIRPGYTRRVKVAPGRNGTIPSAAMPGQKLTSHASFAQHKPRTKDRGLRVVVGKVVLVEHRITRTEAATDPLHRFLSRVDRDQ